MLRRKTLKWVLHFHQGKWSQGLPFSCKDYSAGDTDVLVMVLQQCDYWQNKQQSLTDIKHTAVFLSLNRFFLENQSTNVNSFDRSAYKALTVTQSFSADKRRNMQSRSRASHGHQSNVAFFFSACKTAADTRGIAVWHPVKINPLKGDKARPYNVFDLKQSDAFNYLMFLISLDKNLFWHFGHRIQHLPLNWWCHPEVKFKLGFVKGFQLSSRTCAHFSVTSPCLLSGDITNLPWLSMTCCFRVELNPHNTVAFLHPDKM